MYNEESTALKRKVKKSKTCERTSGGGKLRSRDFQTTICVLSQEVASSLNLLQD